MIRVGISGGYGRMGTLVASVVEAEDDMELVGRYDPSHGDHSLLEGSDVVVEVTRPDVVMGNLAVWRDMGAHCVVGTSGFGAERLAEAGELWEEAPSNCLIVPNFSVGAVLMMHFAAAAASHFPMAEVIEYHHPDKRDAPSGTAIATARLIGASRTDDPAQSGTAAPGPTARGEVVDGVSIHSVRMAGIIADQEVVFGDDGQTLRISHHTQSREAFAPGIRVAVRGVGGLSDRLTVGLNSLLGI